MSLQGAVQALVQMRLDESTAEGLGQGLRAAGFDFAALELSNPQAQVGSTGDMSGGLVSSRFSFAIRHDDLTLLAWLMAAANTWAGAGFFLGGITPPQVISLVVSFFGVAWQLKRKGATLNALQLQILLALKSRPTLGLSTQELLDFVNVSADEDWSWSQVDSELQALRSAATETGPTELVKPSGDRWMSTA
jgi:hypothetical protein